MQRGITVHWFSQSFLAATTRVYISGRRARTRTLRPIVLQLVRIIETGQIQVQGCHPAMSGLASDLYRRNKISCVTASCITAMWSILRSGHLCLAATPSARRPQRRRSHPES
jgi:hypothetical protein